MVKRWPNGENVGKSWFRGRNMVKRWPNGEIVEKYTTNWLWFHGLKTLKTSLNYFLIFCSYLKSTRVNRGRRGGSPEWLGRRRGNSAGAGAEWGARGGSTARSGGADDGDGGTVKTWKSRGIAAEMW